MNEPVKKPDRSPEGYSPKEVPEIVRLAEKQAQAQGKTDSAPPIVTSSGGSGIVPIIRPLIKDGRGENYWFNGCAAYAMECLGEIDYDYWFFAGLTGDIFTQFYALKEKYNACAVSDIFMGPAYAKWVFDQVGYACEYVTERELLANKEHYLQKLMDSIDRGVPVIHCNWGVFVGYEDGGKTLLYITHEMEAPGRLTVGDDRFIKEREFYYTDERKMPFDTCELIFVGEKTRDVPLARLYREAILRLPQLLTTRMDGYRFGADAFLAFAGDIERGRFDDPAVLGNDAWGSYTNYICVLATNGSCCFSFLEKAMELNPDMTWLKEIVRQYRRMGMLWTGHEGGNKEQQRFEKEYRKQHGRIKTLEKLGGGFNVCWKTLQKRRKRAKIVARIREFAGCADEALRILEKEVRER